MFIGGVCMIKQTETIVLFVVLFFFLLSCTNHPQSNTIQQIPILHIETICSHQQSDLSVQGPLLLQDNQYFFKDMIYESNQMHYKAIDVESKELLWDVTYPDLRSPWTALRIVNQDSVFFPTSITPIEFTKSEIVALNRSDGSIRWKYGPLESIVIVDCMTVIQDYLFVATSSRLYVLNIHMGKLLWSKHITELLPFSKETNEHYSIDSIFSNQTSVLIQYNREITDANSQLKAFYDGVLSIQLDNGSTQWQYETNQEERVIMNVTSEAINKYVLAYGAVLLNANNGQIIWQYAPDGVSPSDIKYIGYEASNQMLIYTFHQNGTVMIVGLDIKTGVEKWRQSTQYSSYEFYMDQNHQTDQIFSFYTVETNNDDASKDLPINQMDVFDSKDGNLLQTYTIPKSIWFKNLASEIRYMKGYWYFVGQSLPDDIGHVSLFRFNFD